MIVRKLEQKGHVLSRSLYEAVFYEDPISFVDYYYKEKTAENQILVVEEDCAIRSMLHLNPYEMYLNGRIFRTYYTVAVATQEAYRHRGYASELVRRALHEQYREGCPFSFLMPAHEGIYLPHGYRTVYEQNTEYFDRESAKKSTVRKLSPENYEEVCCYENQRLKEQYQVFTYRNERYYERLTKETESTGGNLLIERQDGGRIKAAQYFPDLDVETLGKHLIMIRIVNLTAMMESISFSEQATLCFRVTDPILEENNGVFSLRVSEKNGYPKVKKSKEDIDGCEGVLSITSLEELIFGVKSVEEVCASPDTEISSRLKEKWKKLIPLFKICINEEV